MKATAIAPSNIAFIKYWGRKDETLRLPTNGSISMNLSNLLTTTTVAFHEAYAEDVIVINDKIEQTTASRAVKHLDRIRKLAGITERAKVVSENNFPTGTGLSSSASGFAALTLAAVSAAGLNLSGKQLSILARQGSGSACRSIPDGFTQWLDGDSDDASYAVSLHPADYWDIVDIVAVVNVGPKDIPTSEGQKSAETSPFFDLRVSRMPKKIERMKTILRAKDFKAFGELVEEEALELHAIMLTSNPSLIYWLPGTMRMMRQVKKWRSDGLEVYFTVNTGQDIHLICQKKDAEKVAAHAEKVEGVRQIITNEPTKGASIIDKHLF